jgi:hypothetical protein
VCVSFHLQGKDRIHYLSVSFVNFSGFFRLCKECTTGYWKLCSQRKECAYELFESEKNMPGGHTRIIHRLRGNLKVVEYLGGKSAQE